MSKGFSKSLWLEIVGEFRLRNPCYVVVYGPPGAGKTDLIDDIYKRSLDETSPKIICLRLDLRAFVPNEASVMFGKVIGKLHANAIIVGIVSKWPGKVKADAADLNSLVVTWLAATSACLLLAVDHLDAAPRSLVRILLRALRAFNDQSASNPEYNRVGAIIAGATTVYDMREDLYSMLVGSRFIALPSADLSIREELVSEFLSRQNMGGAERLWNCWHDGPGENEAS